MSDNVTSSTTEMEVDEKGAKLSGFKRRYAECVSPCLSSPESGDQPKVYSGSKLVSRVLRDLRKKKAAEIESGWGAQRAQVQEEMVNHKSTERSKRRGVKEKSTWSWRDLPVPGPKERIVVNEVKAQPPMIYYAETPINIPTPDSKTLTHIPYMEGYFKGEGKRLEKEENAFSEGLLDMYDQNFHGDDELQLETDGTDLITFVRVLMELGEKLFGQNSDDLEYHEKPNQKNLQDIYDKVIKADEKTYELMVPPKTLLEAVCNKLDPEMKITHEDLYKRYINLSRKRNPEFGILKKTPPQNIDAPKFVGISPKDAQMDSYKSLFCRLCFQYSCQKHPALRTEDEIAAALSVASLQREENQPSKPTRKKGAQRPVSRKGAKCKDKNCCKELLQQSGYLPPLEEHPVVMWENILEEWQPVEITMFYNCFDKIQDYCIVANLIGTKSCRQVMYYHRISEVIRTKSKHPSLNWLKKHYVETSADSESRSNLTTPENEIPPSTPGSSGYNGSNSPDALPSKTPEHKQGTVGIPAEHDNLEELTTFTPCLHANGKCDASCPCVVAKRKCESVCGCLLTCRNRWRGCVCSTTCTKNNCPCRIQNRECDPDLCKRCGSHEMDMNNVSCRNVGVQRRIGKKIYLKDSLVSGWGAFAQEKILKNDFIIEYTGELISSNEAEKRGLVYDTKLHTFLFGLSDGLVLDALNMGSPAKFINSSKKPNCLPVKVNIKGEIRLAIRALRDIEKDEELFFNYHHILNPNKGKKQKKSQKYAS